jgi:hypothetical protein
MQTKLIFIICIILISHHGVEGGATCYCNCCLSTSCAPVLVGSYALGGICGVITCNQAFCFTSNPTQCPAFGAVGNMNAVCANAYSVYKHFSFAPIIILFTIFGKFYQY